MDDIDDMLNGIASTVFSAENQEPDIDTKKLFREPKLIDDGDDDNLAPV